MKIARLDVALGGLAAVAALAVAAPWLPLRDPSAQPDGLVLRDLPPLSRAEAVVLANGAVRYAHEVRATADGGAEIRRGSAWERIAPGALAGSSARTWHRRTLFPLGTDGFGRDLLSRLVYGARVSLLVGVVAALVAVALGTAVGLSAGLLGGWADGLLMRFTDLALSVPRLFLLLLLVALHGSSVAEIIVVLGTTSWMTAARLVRGEVLSQRERDYVRAAIAAGATRWRVALRHLMPAVAGVVLVEGTLRVGNALLLESSLSFLGLGVPPPTPSWGSIVADGRDALVSSWWIATLPGVAIAATVLAVNGVGERLRARLSAGS